MGNQVQNSSQADGIAKVALIHDYYFKLSSSFVFCKILKTQTLKANTLQTKSMRYCSFIGIINRNMRHQSIIENVEIFVHYTIASLAS